MLLNDDPGIIDRGAAHASEALPEDAERRDAGSGWQWLLPWLLALTGMIITVALSR